MQRSITRPGGTRSATSPAPTNVSTFEPIRKSSSKTRLNLLNPMNLLARRRSAQAAVQIPTATATASTSRNSASYDPRIRGTKVHDFSAPRPRPGWTSSPDNTLELNAPLNQDSDVSPDKDGGEESAVSAHTPVFKEDFDDAPHVKKANDFSDLQVPMPAYARGGKDKELPPKPKSPQEPETGTLEKPVGNAEVTSEPVKTARPAYETRALSYEVGSREDIALGSLEKLALSNASKAPLSGSGFSVSSRRRNDSDASRRPHPPRHIKSNSSRFSFDMIGAATEEKLLEDRHREKAAGTQFSGPDNEYGNEDDDDYYDDIMDDDGLEERIPGVNADYEEEENIPEDAFNFPGFTFQSSADPTPDTSPDKTVAPTPRDSSGDVIGAALTRSPFDPNILLAQAAPKEQEQGHPTTQVPDVSLSHTDNIELQGSSSGSQSVLKGKADFTISHYEDDMYFDDGTFGMDEDDFPQDQPASGDAFDESVFDNEDTDQHGRPLRRAPSTLPTTSYSPAVLSNAEASRRESAAEAVAKEAADELSFMPFGASNFADAGGLKPQPSVAGANPLKASASLTQDTLKAYQQALAAATQNAFSNGRFNRDSIPEFNDDNRLPDDFEEDLGYGAFNNDYDATYDDDDGDYDDDFIAAANAEALENDDEGFYREEFGFYSKPAAGKAAQGLGGFFGPQGAQAITIERTKSGKIKDVSLTPITERSEYSNRNSIMSLPQLGSAIGSPPLGLSQIASMLPEEEDENMSMSALLRARNRAFGSQTSLNVPCRESGGACPVPPSQLGDDGNSPVWTYPQHIPWSQQNLSSSPEMSKLQVQQESYGFGVGRPRQNRRHSGFSAATEDESPRLSFVVPHRPKMGEAMGSSTSVLHGRSPSPTKCMGYGDRIPAPPANLRHTLDLRPTSPTRLGGAVGFENLTAEEFDKEVDSFSRNHGNATTPALGQAQQAAADAERRKHKKTASNDSISYMRENDPVNGERWVVERTRTGDGGLEVERRVVSGGRI